MISLQYELRNFKKRSVNTYYNKAIELVKDNNISKAISLMEKSLEDITEDIETLNLIGLCQYILCNFDQASLYWNKSLVTQEEDNRAKYYIDYLKSDKFKSFKEYYDLAINYIDKSKYKEAIELLLEINKTNKDLVEPYALIGNCYYALEEDQLAKQYLEQALAKDIKNLKNLSYLHKINNKIPLDIKRPKTKNHKWNYKRLLIVVALIIIIMIPIGFYQKYKQDIKTLSSELDKSKSENSKLEERLEKEKVKDTNKEEIKKDDNDKIEEKIEEVDNKDLKFTGTEAEIFDEAREDFTKQDYSKSRDKFEYLINTSNNEDLLAESIYFMAVAFEKEKNYDKAEQYYNSYIDRYRERNYYDDSLYNYGLMLFEKGDIKTSKEVLQKLKREEPESDFVNSRVEAILNN